MAEIDDSLYSRQRYVLGDSAMYKMGQSNILIHGLGSVGVEIAKNVALAGVKAITLQDCKVADYFDLSGQFFLKESDVCGKVNRAAGSFEQLKELNPYVEINLQADSLESLCQEEGGLEYLKTFHCVILTELSLDCVIAVNKFCRANGICTIVTDVFGVFSWLFCDFCDDFTVVDIDGEDPPPNFIASITCDNPGIVTMLDHVRHNLQDDDTVIFKEVRGMTALNDQNIVIKVLSPFAFSIGDTSKMSLYENGGIVKKVMIPKIFKFESLKNQLDRPSLIVADLGKMEIPQQCHWAMQALHAFVRSEKRFPNIRCVEDANVMIDLASQIAGTDKALDRLVISQLSYTAQGCFPPLAAAIGGIAAQEVLKALTGKFSPLQQWLYLDAMEVVNNAEPAESCYPCGDHQDGVRVCLGSAVCTRLSRLKLFMVGCGAIGCEMMKNFAGLGIATHGNGLISITDNDLIEKSNLNRQFLFRPRHIQKAKSLTAAEVLRSMLPGVKVDAQIYKVCPETATVYNDLFFRQQDIIINALDNLAARRYMDSRCVTNQKPLLESGTMGAKGHTQVIIPHKSESYSSQQDPQDQDVPFCTLKSFPATIEHCIQWSRDKFESSFVLKPAAFNQFWSGASLPAVLDALRADQSLDGVVCASKLAANRPKTFADCACLARMKFEKYFSHKAQRLLHALPLDTRLADGSLLWQSPKRPPAPLQFSMDDKLHLDFILACSKLYAVQYKIPIPQDISVSLLEEALEKAVVPDFLPSNKTIVIDESVTESPTEPIAENEPTMSLSRLKIAQEKFPSNCCTKLKIQEFEKDDDTNSHIDFIAAAANLRATMYSIETSERLNIKRIAGRIVPAIATTTAAVAGLVSIELVKLVLDLPLDQHRNCFMNLALPSLLFAEPGPAPVQQLKNGVKFTLWDRWTLKGNESISVQQLIDLIHKTYDLRPTMIVQGTKMIYMILMPPHRKRLTQAVKQFLKISPNCDYVDLSIAENDDEMAPPLRYFY